MISQVCLTDRLEEEEGGGDVVLVYCVGARSLMVTQEKAKVRVTFPSIPYLLTA